MNNNEYLERLLKSVKDSFVCDERESGEVLPQNEETAESIRAESVDSAVPEEDYASIERVFEKLSRKIEAQKTAEEKRKNGMLEEIAEWIPLGWFFLELAKPVKEPAVKSGSLKRRMLPTAGALLLSVCILCAVAFYILRADSLRAMMSVEQLEVCANAYSMEYDGSYGFNDFLRQGGASSDEELMEFLSGQFSGGLIEMPQLTQTDAQCLDGMLTARDSLSLRGVLTGHSFHNSKELMTMVVTTWSTKGMETVSVANLNWLGYTPYSPPDIFNRYAALAALYLPMSGMNNCGLAVAALEVSDAPAPVRDTERPDLTVTTAVRLLLDKADYVDEAVALLEKFDIFPSCGRDYHLAISDSEGSSVVVEWVDGAMVVTRSPCAANGFPSASEKTDERLLSLYRAHFKYGGDMTASQVMDAMQRVSPDGDGWIAIYDIGNYSASFCFDGDYEKQLAVSMRH